MLRTTYSEKRQHCYAMACQTVVYRYIARLQRCRLLWVGLSLMSEAIVNLNCPNEI
jgi:hypothetical protein